MEREDARGKTGPPLWQNEGVCLENAPIFRLKPMAMAEEITLMDEASFTFYPVKAAKK